MLIPPASSTRSERRKATKAPRRLLVWLARTREHCVHIDSADSPYCRDFEHRESQFGNSETQDQQDITEGRATLAAHATASGA